MSYIGNISFSNTYNNDTDSDYVYYNASIINNKTGAPWDRSTDPQIRFLETRDVPIIKDASKYNFSIIRFTMNGPNKDLPLFIPIIRTGIENLTNNVNLTIYSVTLRMTLTYSDGTTTLTDTFTATQPIIYSPETLDAQIAPVPNPETCQTGQDVSTRYYWIYTYAQWLKLSNIALTAAMASIQTQFQTAWTAASGAGTPTLTTAAPFLTFNPTSGLFSIYADRYGFGGPDRTSVASTTDNENCSLYFNSNMFGLFTNFANLYYNELGTELTNEIICGNTGAYQNLITVPAGTPAGVTPLVEKTYWVMTQENESTSSLWSPIESIVFNSTLLPLEFEQTGDPVRFGTGNTNTEYVNSQPAFQPIITDIALAQQKAYNYREFLEYAPTAEYRMASFQRSRQTINQIDVQVYWKNRLDGQLYPVQMFNASSVSIKILFRRRGVHKDTA